MNQRLLLVLLAAGALTSCETYHFAERQPVDRKDLVRFPKSFLGNWKMEGIPGTIAFESNQMVFVGGDTIFNGIADTAYHGKKKALKTRFWSRANQRMDTITDYIVHNNNVYGVESDHLTRGFPLVHMGDSILFGGKLTFTLGEGLSLRKVNDTLYLLHAKTTSLLQEMEGNGPWWSIMLIEIHNGEFYASYFNNVIEKDPALIESFNNDYYFDARWTANDILKLRDSIFRKREKPILVRNDHN